MGGRDVLPGFDGLIYGLWIWGSAMSGSLSFVGGGGGKLLWKSVARRVSIAFWHAWFAYPLLRSSDVERGWYPRMVIASVNFLLFGWVKLVCRSRVVDSGPRCLAFCVDRMEAVVSDMDT